MPRSIFIAFNFIVELEMPAGVELLVENNLEFLELVTDPKI